MNIYRKILHGLLPIMVCSITLPEAEAQFAQQGAKQVGTNSYGPANQGVSVALSEDGNTAIVGGPTDSTSAGAAWIFIRSSGTWSQQGEKLYGSDAVGYGQQGWAVAISGDGNTAIVGGNFDNTNAGAAWVFTRSAGVWTQQGNKLVGTPATSTAEQGYSVAISWDGNTVVIGGWDDNSGPGAAWVFTRSGSTWTQQAKLVGTGAANPSSQGSAVAVSGDGNTVIVGGPEDNGSVGATWVFTRSGSVWSQQGTKLVGSDAAGAAYQGTSISLSYDGNTAIVGGSDDNGTAGAAWIYVRSGGVWSQQGNKLVGTGAIGNAQQGYSVSIAANANKAIVGGPNDNNRVGAAWLYTRSGSTWTEQKIIGTGGVARPAEGAGVSISGDENTAVIGGPYDNFNAGAAWFFYNAPAATATSTITGGSTAPVTFTGTGVTVRFTAANVGDLNLTVSRYNSSPGGSVSGIGLANLGNVYWPILINSGTVTGTYSITLDLSAVGGINDFSTLHLLKRNRASSAWTDAGVPSNITGAPTAVVWSGLTSFSQFALGGSTDNPLPIQLLSFSGSMVSGNRVRLEWATVSEVNNYGFQVQRSRGPQDEYQSLPDGFVQGHGTTAQPHQYSYTDATAAPAEWSYRLKQIDLDGTFHYTDPIEIILTGAKEVAIPSTYSLGQNYPNPFNPSTTISYALPEDASVSLAVYNIIGQKVAQLVEGRVSAGYHEAVLDASQLTSGVYIYKLQASNFAATRKLLLLK
jgi:hypothetical protein